MKKIIIKNDKNNYLCFYDIEDTKRRNKLIKFLKKYGERIQKSVFIIFIDKNEKVKLIDYFKKIKNKDDKLGLAILCENCYSKIFHLPSIKFSQYDLI